MKKLQYFSVFILFMVIGCVFSCKKTTQAPVVNYIDKDTLNYEVIADTITYDVVIKNSVRVDPVTDSFLRYLDKTSLIDEIFSSIYSGKLQAYDYFTKTRLSPEAVKEIESGEGFSRDAIGKIQFAEVWYFNSDENIFKKKVISMILGLEQFNSDGTLRGYKPVFKIYLN